MTWQYRRASIAAAVVLVGILGAVLAGTGPGDSHHHSDASSVETPRERAELIGTQAPGWETAKWLTDEPVRLRDLRGKVVLVRWWTDTCPFCRRSAPALNEFHERYAAHGLVLIGMYHPKPIHRPITADLVREAAEERGFRFPIAIDRDWSIVRRWWLDGTRIRQISAHFGDFRGTDKGGFRSEARIEGPGTLQRGIRVGGGSRGGPGSARARSGPG
ncbi:MAG: peroxiredoxin family protein [Planctomycetota bacterium]